MSLGISANSGLNLIDKLNKNIKSKTENLTSEVKQEFLQLEAKFDEYAGKSGLNLKAPIETPAELTFNHHKVTTSLAKRISGINESTGIEKDTPISGTEKVTDAAFPVKIRTSLGERLERLGNTPLRPENKLTSYTLKQKEYVHLLQNRAEKVERNLEKKSESNVTSKKTFTDIAVVPAALSPIPVPYLNADIASEATGFEKKISKLHNKITANSTEVLQSVPNPALIEETSIGTEKEQYRITTETVTTPSAAGPVPVPYFSVQISNSDIAQHIVNGSLKLAGDLVKNSELLFRNGKIKTDKTAEMIINKFSETGISYKIKAMTARIIASAFDDIVKGTATTENIVKNITEKATKSSDEIMKLIINLMNKTNEIQAAIIRNIR